jgi:hypothetical protein
MLTYENFVAVLLGSLEQAGINIAYTQELLDTHALGRSLSITCLPDGVEDDRGPQEPPLRATISFRWSPEFTVFSLQGGVTFANIERLVDERLFQAQSGPSLDVEVLYILPVTSNQQRDVGQLPLLAHAMQQLYAALVGSDVPIRVDGQISFSAGRPPRLQGVQVQRVWSIDEALYDADLLSDTFDELCTELHDMLEALAESYLVSDDDETGNGNNDAPTSDRRYLKPPTA